MIADLRVKGKDSAGKLRKALYSMFDLDVVESAIAHIGRTDLRTTVLGKLYLSKGTISSGSQISATKTNIEQIQVRLAKFEQDIADATAEQTAKQNLLVELSEKIGGHKSKSDYERQRKACKTQRDIFLKNAEAAQASFGDAVLDMFPQLLISKAVADAKKKIHLKVEQQKLPGGVNKKLINYLLAAGTTECVCGRPLCAEEKAHIEAYLSMLPPKSFSSLYQEFSNTARIWGKGYDKSRIEAYIMSVLENNKQASECDNRVRELDEAEKKSPDIESLIVARQQAESDLRELGQQLEKLIVDKKKLEVLLKQRMRLFDQYTQENAAAVKVNGKIQVMEQVAAYFRRKLEQASLTYSQSLEANIQSLIDAMLTSKRKVAVSPEFSVRVTDSFNDESKSEGQFAVVSFAYIGGILKMLRSEEQLSAKEYPLVLDGPFSKLDPDQRQNVVNMIPEFAPQVILFSKDDLHGVFAEENIGRVWTIVSNEEKNVARIEEGHLWK